MAHRIDLGPASADPASRLSGTYAPEMIARRLRGIVYGPVRSRRLGLSLGINVTPQGQKVCPLNCVYCEVGEGESDLVPDPRLAFPNPEDVFSALESSLRSGVQPVTITFSGSGEPTAHPQFQDLVAQVCWLRDRYFPAGRDAVRVVVLSNGVFADRAGVRVGLAQADVRLMKLDAGDEHTFRAVNRPPASLALERVVDNLGALRDVTLQTLLVDGSVSNVAPSACARYLDAVRLIRPTSIQLYTVSRATPVQGLRVVPDDMLRTVAKEVAAATGIPAQVFGERSERVPTQN